jgi:hypothetical protein
LPHNNGKRTRLANGGDGYIFGMPHRRGTSRPFPGMSVDNQPLEQGAVHFPSSEFTSTSTWVKGIPIIRIISCRKAKASERRIYEKGEK